MSAPVRRLRACVENWPEAETGAYDPHCCRFPKSCSATVYDEGQVAEEDLEPRGAAPLARVGDVIAHGEAIPANVRRVRDRARDLWGRFDEGWLLTSYKGEPCDATGSPLYPDLLSAQWGPLEVVEVDPEAQPAEPGMVADGCSWCVHHGYTPGQQLTAEGVPVEHPTPTPLDVLAELRVELMRLHPKGYAGRCGPAFNIVDRLENAVREVLT